MFCYKCGTKLRDGAQFCHNCGTSVAEPETNQKQQPPQQTQSVNQTPNQQTFYQPVYQPQPQSKPYYAPGTHPYHRLGGFLMFIVVGSYISGVVSFINVISTIISFSSLLKMGNLLPGGFKAWIIINIIVFAILYIWSGVICIKFANMLRGKDPDFFHFIQSSSIALIITLIIWYLISMIWVKQYDRYGAISWGEISQSLIAMVIAMIIGIVLGSVYYGCSIRLRTYMGSDDYLKLSVFNKNSHPIPADGSDQPQYEQNINMKNSPNRSFNPTSEWMCPKCDSINSNYVTTCKCGEPKPNKAAFISSWKCKNCGKINSADHYSCSSCGSFRK